MVRTNQGGSILGFIVIGAVMAALLIGGVYLVRQNLIPGVKSGAESLQDSSDSTKPSKDETENAKNEGDQSTAQDGQASEPAAGTEQATDKPRTQTGSGTISTTDLPETGPAGILLSGLFLSLVVAVTSAYIRSRGLASSL